ncbi:MAG: hypothetical protein IJ512_08870 [Ruminococcus sp.]|nr:hypothetical protein [Ruminococcus sp.]
MKKWICLLTAVCMMSFCACSREQEDAVSRQELVLNTRTEPAETTSAETKAVQAETQTKQAEQETAENGHAFSDETAAAEAPAAVTAVQTSVPEYEAEIETEMQETALIEEIPVPETTDAPVTVPSVYPEETAPGEGIFGAEGRTAGEWLILGQEMYRNAAEVSFRYLHSGSAFPFDFENLEIIDRTYFLTTCPSFADATAPYYDIFSREYHGSDFDGILLEQDGRLYAARAARGMDITYLSSEVTALVSVSPEEVVFDVQVQYEDREITDVFTLVPEDGFWKVGEFTLPY